MKNLNKILTIIATLCCFIPSLTLADNSDCGIFGPLQYQQGGSTNSFKIVDQVRETKDNKFTNFLTPEQQKAIITKDDLNTALLNLKKYCCDHELGGLEQNFDTCKKDKSLYNDNSLDSPYLFDHLFDVIMRRLNGLSGENNIYTKTNMTLDDKGTARRARISKKATSSEGAIPQTIIDEYKKLRTLNTSDIEYNIADDKIYSVFGKIGDGDPQNFLNYVGGNGGTESKSVANALQNYKEWNLYYRYKNACALGEYFYALLDISGKSTDRKRISSAKCDNMIKTQINDNAKYTSWVIKESSTQFLSNSVSSYVEYNSNRGLNIQELGVKIINKGLDVIRAVPCLQPVCVK